MKENRLKASKKKNHGGAKSRLETMLKEEEEIAELWRSYKENPCRENRERLILRYAPLVKQVAARVSSGLPPSVDFSDLVSYGIFGLLDAIERFDPSRGIKFETYAIARIKGAIIDELRAEDWVPRSIRHKAREVEKVYAALENELKRIPTDAEVASRLGISVEEYLDLLNKFSVMSLVALDELWSVSSDKLEKIALADMVEDEKSIDPSEKFELEEMKNIIADAINRLPEREKLVISLYYYEGLNMREIGEVLNVTESRICQLHTRAIFRLKARLASVLGFHH